MTTRSACLLILSATVLLSGCSKKEDPSAQDSREKVREDPQSTYGKAIKKTEDLTTKIEQDHQKSEAMLEE